MSEVKKINVAMRIVNLNQASAICNTHPSVKSAPIEVSAG